MARSRQPRQSRGVSTTKPPNHTAAARTFDDEEMSDDDQSIPPTEEDRGNTNDSDSSATDQDDEEGQLKSNVWNYAAKVSSEEARCARCKCLIKTVHGGTSTLRKHLVTKHNLTHLTLHKSQRRESKQSTISRERKIRLDYLANLAIYEDGRTFTDFRKSGIRKFLAEAIPDDDGGGDGDGDGGDESDDDENHDLITDAWNEGVNTGDTGEMDLDQNDDDDDETTITKQILAETIQKGRSLIKTIRRSQILTMHINDEKEKSKMNRHRRLVIDCMSRWNSTYLSLKSLIDHKPMLVNLFENKRKLPLTSKQKEKLYGLELSSDDWLLLTYLLEIFEPFYQATHLLSGSKYPTIGLSLYAIRNLKEYFEVEGEDDSSVVLTLKRFVLESLNHYFNENDQQFKQLMFYGYFDPKGYSVLTSTERTKIERQLKQKSKEQAKSQPSTTISSPSTATSTNNRTSIITATTNTKQNNAKPSRLDMFLNSIDKNVSSNHWNPKTISEEISHYGSLCKKYAKMDAMNFWKAYGDQMPLLKVMAQQHLATPATSVASESAFSSSSYVGRKERARLSPENLGYTVFVQDKLRSPL